MTHKLLRLYRQVAYSALFEYPNVTTGKGELRRIRDIVRQIVKSGDDNSDKRACAFLRYSVNEIQATIQLAKYRHMKNAYNNEVEADQ